MDALNEAYALAAALDMPGAMVAPAGHAAPLYLPVAMVAPAGHAAALNMPGAMVAPAVHPWLSSTKLVSFIRARPELVYLMDPDGRPEEDTNKNPWVVVTYSKRFVQDGRRRQEDVYVHEQPEGLCTNEAVWFQDERTIREMRKASMMNGNMFGALDDLNDEELFGAAPAPGKTGQDLKGTGKKKAQPLSRAPRAPFTFAYPQTACPPVVASVPVNEKEIVHPPKAVLTVHQAKKAAAMRLGVIFGSDVIIYV